MRQQGARPSLLLTGVIVLLSVSCHDASDDRTVNIVPAAEPRFYRKATPSDVMSIQHNLLRAVTMLAEKIGSRGYLELDALERTADFITSELRDYGYSPTYQSYEVDGNTYRNVVAEIRGAGTPEKLLVIGAHYDTVTGTPGADDNASGIAGLLELARLLKNSRFKKTVQFVAFTLEEPPFFRTNQMGSYQYAASLNSEGKEIEGMICLESIGYFRDTTGSQLFPLPFFRWFFPSRGNFIAFVSDLRSRNFLRRSLSAFKKGSALPVESLSTFSFVPGVDLSDHHSFWKFGYKAIMVTDTAFYRNQDYHGRGDTPDTLDYARMAEVVTGLTSVIEEIAGK